MLDSLAFLILFTLSYKPYEDLEDMWFSNVHYLVTLLLHQTGLAAALPGTPEGTNAAMEVEHVLQSWTAGLEPNKEAVALFECLGILRTAMKDDGKLLAERSSCAPLIVGGENLSNWTIYTMEACARIRRILIDNVALAGRGEIIRSLSRGLDIGGLFHELRAAEVSIRSIYMWLAFDRQIQSSEDLERTLKAPPLTSEIQQRTWDFFLL